MNSCRHVDKSIHVARRLDTETYGSWLSMLNRLERGRRGSSQVPTLRDTPQKLGPQTLTDSLTLADCQPAWSAWCLGPEEIINFSRSCRCQCLNYSSLKERFFLLMYFSLLLSLSRSSEEMHTSKTLKTPFFYVYHQQASSLPSTFSAVARK